MENRRDFSYLDTHNEEIIDENYNDLQQLMRIKFQCSTRLKASLDALIDLLIAEHERDKAIKDDEEAKEAEVNKKEVNFLKYW